MKISRRKSLWTIIGGAIAPTIAKSESLNFPNKPLYSPPQSSGWAENAKDIAITDPFYRTNRIKHLQKQINGEFEDWQLENLEQSEQLAEPPNILALKSVSPAYKWEMIKNNRKEQQKRSWVRSAMKELKQMMRLE